MDVQRDRLWCRVCTTQMVIQPETILIVGASGFLGEATSRYCVKQGMATIGIDIVAPDANIAYTSFYRTEQLESTLGPILEKWRPNYLINLAGNADVGKSMSHPRNDFKKSVELFSVILEQVRHFSIDTKVMLASSAAVYGQPKRLPIDESEMPQPLSPYGYHKWLCELLAKEYSEIYGLKIASARIFSAYGSGLKKQILWDLCHKCSNAGLIELDGDGSESRDFIHAEDIAIAILCILRGAKYVGESYNVGSGQEISISTLAHLVIKQFDIPSERLVFSHADRIGDPRNWRADITKLQLLGFVPTVDFSKGVAKYVNWFKEK
jgi:UDP-glucose 4-epimerase